MSLLLKSQEQFPTSKIFGEENCCPDLFLVLASFLVIINIAVVTAPITNNMAVVTIKELS